MKLDTRIAEVEGNAAFVKSEKFEVDEGAMAHVMQTLTQMYQDPYLAIAREYISNSYDAVLNSMNIDTPVGAEGSFGIELATPVEVSLPSALNPAFIIRDYGTGMDAHTLSTVFRKYGASTKRDANHEIGGFGYGGKSAFAVASNFIVVTVKDGKKNTLVINKDEDGVGVQNYLEEVETTEPNGTVITITLPDPDRLARIFSNSNLLLGFPANSIMVNGKLNTRSVYNEELFTRVSEKGWLLNSALSYSETVVNRWNRASVSGRNELTLLVGPISYSVDAYNFFHKTDAAGERRVQMSSATFSYIAEQAVLNLPIGSVSLTPSRDTLIMDERTENAIINQLNAIAPEVTAYLEKHIAEAVDHADALDRAEAIRGAGYTDIEFVWQGKVIPTRTISPYVADKDNEADKTNTWVTGMRQSSRTSVNVPRNNVDGEVLLVTDVQDEAHAQKLNGYRRAFISQKHKGVSERVTFFFTTVAQADLSEWDEFIAKDVLTADEFLALGTELRKAQAKANRVARQANGTTTVKTTGEVRVSRMFAASGWSDRPELDGADAVAYNVEDATVVYLHADDDENSMDSVFSAATSNTGVHANKRSLLNFVLVFTEQYLPRDKDKKLFAILRVPKNMKRATFLNALPTAKTVLSLSEAFKLAVQNFENAVEFDNLATALNSEEATNSWTDIFYSRPEALKSVKNEALRKFIESGNKAGKYSLDWHTGNRDARAAFAARKLKDSEFFNTIADTQAIKDVWEKASAQSDDMGTYSSSMLDVVSHSTYYLRRNEDAITEIVDYLNYKFPVN